MTETWTGTITTDDPLTSFEDVHLWTPNPQTRSLLSRDAQLHSLSSVHVPSIPLYLVAGPSLEVFSDNEGTSAWLAEALWSQKATEGQDNDTLLPWWSHEDGQSECGILLKVEHTEKKQCQEGAITELLLYAAVKQSVANLPTPPASSSPGPIEEQPIEPVPESLPNVKVYALPLCSKTLTHAEQAPRFLSPRPEDRTTPKEACFLPNPRARPHNEQGAAQKRQSLSSLFDDATRKRRKLKGRGGESISKAMAGIDLPTSRHSSLENMGTEQPERIASYSKGHAAPKSFSRSSTVTYPSLPRQASPSSEYPRPASHSGLLVTSKRSSLHRVESAILPRDSPALSDPDTAFAQQNKAALSKVVMAGMRLHGLQQRKKLGKASVTGERPSTATSLGESISFEAEDEYKLIYHQTAKAVTFVFRRQFSAQAVSQDLMRDMVDKFLSLFCSDPLARVDIDGDLTAFGGGSQKSAGAFDEPSAGSIKPTSASFWSPPIVKKR